MISTVSILNIKVMIEQLVHVLNPSTRTAFKPCPYHNTRVVFKGISTVLKTGEECLKFYLK
jgi:hypothetical protein